MGINPYPVEERVGNYRKMTENVQEETLTGVRTDQISVHKLTYAEILMKNTERKGKRTNMEGKGKC